MRFGWLVAAAAMVTAGQASAVSIVLQPSGTPTITGGQTQTCTTSTPVVCSTAAPTFSRNLGAFSLDVAQLNGTFNFGPEQQGPNANAGIYTYSGSITFRDGALISNVVNFAFNSAQIGTSSVITTDATGFFRNVFVFVPSTGQTLQAVPEPASWALLLMGFGGIGLAMRRRRQTINFRSVSLA